jgi:UDP:flavonoid glycosyltransferase YjiC (YdhE family)
MPSLNVILVAMGSHGDVHPFVGIALRLRQRGHRVQVIANGHFASLVEQLGLKFTAVGTAEEYRALATSPELWKRLEGTRTVLRSIGQTFRSLYEAVAKNQIAGETVVVASSLGFGARVAQDHLHIPTITVHLQPSTFFGLVNPPKLPGLFMPRWMPMWLRRAQLALVDRVADQILASALNALRRELGLPPVRRVLSTYMNSPQCVVGLFPEWFGPRRPDWPPQTQLTGFPLYDERGTSHLSDDLKRFLDAGDAPIAFTPGSAMWTAHRFFEQSARACQILGRRGLLLSRHRDHLPQSLPALVRHVDYAPFSELLPRCAALVHHGGIGTSAQALAAGCRQLVMPHAHDQPDNADRLVALGVARQINPRRYRAPRVARELGLLLESAAITKRTGEIAQRFVGIDAISQTCDVIESMAPSPSTCASPVAAP